MSILAVIDTIENKTQPGSFEILSIARDLATRYGLSLHIVIAGEFVAPAAESAACYGFDVTGIEHESMRYPNPDLLGSAVLGISKEFNARYICIPHTMRGCLVAASIATSACFSCITAVESFSDKNGRLTFRRSLLGGKANLEYEPGERSAFTVQAGSFKAPDPAETPGRVAIRRLDVDSPCRPTAIRQTEEGAVRLEESDVIISAGRGIGARENLELIRTVAKLFPNVAVGASRTICDQKWLPYAHQVGVTGKTVAPKLYIACGISGAQQHIAGMKGSQTVVAINTDPQAAIFSISDYIIVEDLSTFLPILLEKYDELFR